MLLKISFGLLLFLVIFDRQHPGFAQRSTVPLPGNGDRGNGDSCNVVNLHCGVPPPESEGHSTNKRYPGPPGKVGPRGPEGPHGLKGDTGSKGSKGEEAIVNMEEILIRFAGLFVARASTCHELSQSGIDTSGLYTLYDGNGIFEVRCNFTGGGAITEILHDQMGEIQNPTDRRCRGTGCYSWTPNYEIGRNHILSIIEKSRECRQFIKSKCVQTNLLQSSYAWWVSRDGEKMTYWGGATSRRDGYCACGESGTCIRSDLKCNCDSNDRNTVVDEGYLTDKTKLPVQELRFGDLDDSVEYVWHTLGKLECWGGA